VAPKPAVEELPSAAAAVEPEPVTVRFRVSPSTASLFLDDTEVSPETESAALPRDGRKHVLRAEAAGYQTGRLEFVATEDATLDLDLAPLQPVRRVVRARPRGTPPPEPAETTERPSPSQANCVSPFFIDELGIKRVRPECR
jgi:hypothetical protein